MDCAAIIVTHNSGPDLPGLLESLRRVAGELRLGMLVVDSGSTDDTVAVARRFSDVATLDLGANVGYAAAINEGRAFVGAVPSLLILNPDVRLMPGALTSLRRALDEPGVGIAVPALTDEAGFLQRSLRREPTVTRALGEACLGDHFGGRPAWLSEIVRVDLPQRTDWATGAVMLVSAACDRTTGPWDESFFLYSEETEYAARARSLGYAVRYVPEARAMHVGGASGSSSELLALAAVNRVRYYRRRHGRVRSAVFYAVVLLHHALRWRRPETRPALHALIRPSGWDELPARIAGKPA